MNIDWTQQPGPDYVWIEDLKQTTGNCSGWGTSSTTGYYADKTAWTTNAVKSGHITIHHKPTVTPYQPEVGEWCEHAENSLRNKHKGLYYIGKDSSGFKVFNNRKGDLLKFGRPSAFRPIKTEEELFVEAALTLDCHPSEGMLSRTDFVIEMHKAGFKAPE